MKASSLVTSLLLLFPMPLTAEVPFFTEEAETLRPGVLTLDVSIALRDEPRDFGIAPRKQQWDLGDLRISAGLGKFAELQIRGVAVALIEGEEDNSTDSGDWIFGTKIWLLQQKKARPALSFLYEVKLPNGSDEEGGATDETDFFGYFAASKAVGSQDLFHGNLGLGILGNPFSNAEQNDIYILRLAWERKLNEGSLFGIEAVNEGGPGADDDVLLLHVVYARKLGKLVLHGGVGVGLTEDTDDARLALGIRKRLRLWKPGEAVRRNSL